MVEKQVSVGTRRRRDIIAILSVAVAVLALVSLHSSAAGTVGEGLSYALRWFVGQAADIPPLLLAAWAVLLMWGQRRPPTDHKAFSLLMLFLLLVTVLSLVPAGQTEGGGALGGFLSGLLLGAFGRIGAWVVVTALALIAVVLFVDAPASQLLAAISAALVAIARSVGSAFVQGFSSLGVMLSERWQEFTADRAERKHGKKGLWPLSRDRQAAPVAATAPSAHVEEDEVEEGTGEKSFSERFDAFSDESDEREEEREIVAENEVDEDSPSATQGKDSPGSSETSQVNEGKEAFVPRADSEESERVFRLPTISLFQKIRRKKKAQSVDQSQMLEEALASFNVEAKVVDVRRGPVVTRYELQPAPGIQVKRITGLADDLALNLAAAGVRIEAPVPGKSVVGIEVPNKEAATVTFREVIESDAFAKSRSRLSIALGMDIAGNPVIGDLTKWLHLLIAGATGSGKSVCINDIICSLLVKAKPHEVKLLLVDPKRVELAVYDGIPHLLTPVVTDPKQAAGALRWAVKEMEARYKLFADLGVRNIDSYNKSILRDDPPGDPMPYIVVIIDELADLMMVAKSDVEDSICRLAQMARAAGMFLIVATQRPSVDVITGLIKANVPSRISFKVSSGHDARTILDQVGAERLLGKGDMLFYPLGGSKPVRAQGAYISDKEVQAVVKFWKDQGTPDYEEEVIAAESSEVGGNVEDDGDELLEDACRLVVDTGTASISMIQRRFRVGYARAARLIDMMELRGIVGPYQGSKPREVLKSMEELEEMAL